MSKGKTVFVGLSGGVDSSVAALRLIKQGYNVVGVFIKVWHPDFMVCNWEAERLDAMRVAAHLGIPFLTCDAEDTYRDEVAHYFIETYKQGLTPNPDVMCNQMVKFGAFLKFAKSHNADYIATGHYARRVDSNSNPQLYRGIDTQKDQSYFLWTLSEEQLSHSLFPVGDTDKEVIRREAKKAKIPVAEKKDSQGICFLGHVDIAEFLSHYVELKVGDVLDENGEIVGEHKGALVYTLGQRHGFTLFNKSNSEEPHYVTAKDTTRNTITVAKKRPTITKGDTVLLRNLVLRVKIEVGQTLEAQIRYRQKPFKVMCEKIDGDNIYLIPQTEIEYPTEGQSCVLYLGDHCIGGGIIG
jgi:tRNA-uridine 2-sulfurtransferase